MPMPACNPADNEIDDGFPWSPFLDHYLTPGEIEDAFDDANAVDAEAGATAADHPHEWGCHAQPPF